MSDEKGLDSLIVWQKSLLFAVNIGKMVLQKFPDEEKWALSSQIRRSAESISANIAEGYGRYYYQEGIHFAYIARGSLEETYSHLVYAKAMNYIAEDELSPLQKPFLTAKIAKSAEKIQRRFKDDNLRHRFS